MLAATLHDPLAGWFDDVTHAVTSAAGAVAGAVTGAIGTVAGEVNKVGQEALQGILKGCTYAQGALASSGNPYAMAAAGACAAATTGAAYGASGRAGATPAPAAPAGQPALRLPALQLVANLAKPKPWYENWKIMVPLGVVVAGGGITTAVLLSRRGHAARRRR